MKILLVTESYWPNADGGALFEQRLVHGLIKRGHEVPVWAPGRTLHSHKELDGDSTIYRERAVTLLANRKYKVSLWPFWHARKHLQELQPDVLHIHNAYLMGLAALWSGRRRHIPIVATNHFMPENALLNLRWLGPLYDPLYHLIWKYLVWFHNRCQFVTSPTPTAIRLLKDHGLHVPAKAISNGIDTDVFKPGLDATSVIQRYHLPTDRPVILYVGRVDGEKRLDILLGALPKVLLKELAHLVIAGSGKAMKGLKDQAAQIGITDNVTFTGFIEEEDKPLLYNAAAVFAISSPAELQSIVTLEAMASGLPIVAVDVAALSELCHDGENGYLFPENNSVILAQKLIELLQNKQLHKQFGLESRNIVETNHASSVTIKQYEAAYQRALGVAK